LGLGHFLAARHWLQNHIAMSLNPHSLSGGGFTFRLIGDKFKPRGTASLATHS